MKHGIDVSGYSFRLRPVQPEDSAFIVQLRTDPKLSRFLHPISPDVKDQELWIKRYLERAGEYYFIVDRLASGKPEGTISIYDVNCALKRAEWGRWILTPRSLAAAESALLIYRIAFEELGLDALYCRTVAENQAVVSFHDSSGLARTAVLSDHFTIQGKQYAAVQHELTVTEWPTVRERLEKSAGQLHRILSRSKRP